MMANCCSWMASSSTSVEVVSQLLAPICKTCLLIHLSFVLRLSSLPADCCVFLPPLFARGLWKRQSRFWTCFQIENPGRKIWKLCRHYTKRLDSNAVKANCWQFRQLVYSTYHPCDAEQQKLQTIRYLRHRAGSSAAVNHIFGLPCVALCLNWPAQQQNKMTKREACKEAIQVIQD